MSSLERRKLLCSVTFHAVAVTCVIWSLYVLVDRTAQEIRAGQLQWPFWTKLVVVAIGFTGGLVFMYIQCKVYVHLCRKWKAYNRVIVVQDAPEGIHKARRLATQLRREAQVQEEGDGRRGSQETEGEQGEMEGEAVATQRRQSAPPQATTTTTATSTAAAAATASPATTEQASKMNAETQTALRGAAIVEAMQEQQQQQRLRRGHLRKASASAALGRGGGGGGGGGGGAGGAVFFTECEITAAPVGVGARSASSSFSCLSRPATSSSSGMMMMAGEIREPVLICDLPGASSPIVGALALAGAGADASHDDGCSVRDLKLTTNEKKKRKEEEAKSEAV